MARTVERFDIKNPEHAGFMYDLAMACKDDFMNDYDNDILLIMNEYERAIDAGNVVAFLAMVNGEKAGIIWVDKLLYGVGRVRAGLMPSFRNGFTALGLMHQFIDFCFKELDLRKLDAEISFKWKPTGDELFDRKRAKNAEAAEKIFRRVGFRKEGLIREAFTVNGEPQDTLLFGLTRTYWQKQKQGRAS